ncbi:hypothetical protein J6590_031109 [Homalodisca vitripennis]|nr:hypothetical protein J6590_031109 [Homalodisca vitripennis]
MSNLPRPVSVFAPSRYRCLAAEAEPIFRHMISVPYWNPGNSEPSPLYFSLAGPRFRYMSSVPYWNPEITVNPVLYNSVLPGPIFRYRSSVLY